MEQTPKRMSFDSSESPKTDSPRPPLQPPNVRKHSNPLMHTLSYFVDPLSYTASSVARRLAEDVPETALGRALSANINGSLDDTMNHVYHPPSAPQRRPSPFQPPPLTPLSLQGYSSTTRGKAKLMSKAIAEEIRLLVPPRLQLCDHWQLAYSLEQNGSTLSTLYHLCDEHRGKRGGYVLVVRDTGGGIFGAYLSDPPRPQAHYFGSGECFLWRAFRLPALPDLSSLPPPPSEDTTYLGRMTTVAVARTSSSNSILTNGTNGHKSGTATPERIRFKAFPYTGVNDFQIFCQANYLSVGGGDGHYGLWLSDNLSHGVSQTCLTFGNEPLSDDGKKFDVLGVEVWYIGS